MTDIADLVARLDALEKDATPGEWGILGWAGEHDEAGATVGAIASRAVVARTGGDGGSYYRPAGKQYHANPAFIAELRNAYPELRRIVVAAKDYADAYRKWKDLWDAWYAAFKETGEDEWDSLQQAHEEMNSAHDALLAVRGEA